MRETPADIERLQQLLERSIGAASPFLRRSFEMPEHSLSAAQLVAHLQGSLTVAFATVTARGEPRVAPIAALFVRGAFCIPTIAEAIRARHVAKRPAASVTYYEGIDLAVIAHGQATIVDGDDPEFEELDELQVTSGEESVTTWSGRGVYLRIEPATLLTYARYPERFPGP